MSTRTGGLYPAAQAGTGGPPARGRAGATTLHILLVSTVFPSPARPAIVGGAEVVVHRYAEALVAAGTRVSVLRGLPPGETTPVEEVGGIAIHSRAIRRPYWPFDGEDRGAARKLGWHLREDVGDVAAAAAVIRSLEPDVVHTHNIVGLSSGVWRAVASARRPVVHTLHDYTLLCPRTTRFRDGARCGAVCADCRLLTLRRRRDSALIGDVVGVSRAMLDEQVDHGLFAGARRHVIPNIVEPAERAREDASRSGPITFGFLGRPTEEKGILRLAEAFGAMRVAARLVVGGRADPAVQAEAQARAGARPIEFLGFVRPDDFLAAVDVLVVPSIWSDPFPTVILEAQGAGVPTLGSRRGGIPEAIGSDAAGWIFDPDVPDALRALMDKIAADPVSIAPKREAAREASRRFTAERVLTQYRAVYDAALAR